MSTNPSALRLNEFVIIAGLCCGGYAFVLGLLELQDVATNGAVGALRTLSLPLVLIAWGAWLAHWLRRPARPQRHWLALLALVPLAVLAVTLFGPPPNVWQLVAHAFGAVGIGLTAWLPGSPSLATRPVRELPATGAKACQRPTGAPSCQLRRCPQSTPGSAGTCLALEQQRVLEASGRRPTPTSMLLGVMLTLLCLGWAGFGVLGATIGIGSVPVTHTLVAAVLALWVVWLIAWARQQSRPQRTWLAVAGLVPIAVLLAALIDSPDRSDQVMGVLGLLGVVATCWIPGGWPWRDRWPFTGDWPFAVAAGRPESTSTTPSRSGG